MLHLKSHPTNTMPTKYLHVIYCHPCIGWIWFYFCIKQHERVSLSYKLFYNYFMKKPKITPVVCPGTEYTDPLMPIGGYPANTRVSQGLSWDWWGRSQVQRLGVERQQVNHSITILTSKKRENILQNRFQ